LYLPVTKAPGSRTPSDKVHFATNVTCNDIKCMKLIRCLVGQLRQS